MSDLRKNFLSFRLHRTASQNTSVRTGRRASHQNVRADEGRDQEELSSDRSFDSMGTGECYLVESFFRLFLRSYA